MAAFSIIMAVLSVVVGVVSTVMADKANQQNIQQAKETREDVQQFNAEQADKANQNTINQYYQLYSPAAKMQQLEQAGLSPGLFYGTAGGGTGSASSAQATAGAAPIPTITNPLAGLMDSMITTSNMVQGGKRTDNETKKTNSEVERNLAETKKLEEEAKTEAVTRNYQDAQTKLAEQQLKFEQASYETQLQILENNRILIAENIRKTRAEITEQKIKNKYAGQLYESTLELNNALRETYVSENTLNLAKVALTNAEKTLTDSKKQLTDQEKENLGLEYRKLLKIVEEYETFGYKGTEADNWASEVIVLVKEIIKYFKRGKKPDWVEQQDKDWEKLAKEIYNDN